MPNESRLNRGNGANANKKYLFEYWFDGIKWCAEVWASTPEEAEMKIKAMGKGALVGPVVWEDPPGGDESWR